MYIYIYIYIFTSIYIYIYMTPERNPKQLTVKRSSLDSMSRHHGGDTPERKSCRSNHGRGNHGGVIMEEKSLWRTHGGASMDEQPWRSNREAAIMEKQSERRNYGGEMMEENSCRRSRGEDLEAEAPRRHPGSLQEAYRSHPGARLRYLKRRPAIMNPSLLAAEL